MSPKIFNTFLIVVLCYAIASGCFNPKQCFAGGGTRVQPDGATKSETNTGATADHTQLTKLARLPLRFEANRGQTAKDVSFIARGLGYSLLLMPGQAVVNLRQSRNQEPSVLRIRLEGASRNVSLTGQDELPVKTNYMIGQNPELWRRDVPSYSAVLCRNLYRGIDLLYYGNQQQLEYDYRVKANADPSRIRFSIDGAKRMSLNKEGDLIITLPSGERVIQRRPVAYQTIEGGRKEVACSYLIRNGRDVRFRLGSYDHARDLTIDPLLTYSTLVGGSSYDTATGIGVDSTGAVYVTGYTESVNFPGATGNFQPALSSGQDAFIFKLNAAGSALVYATYLGGSGYDRANKIKVDSSGTAYIVGQTYSANFPVTAGTPPAPGCFQPSFRGGGDAFITKLSADGRSLIYSSYLGGSLQDYGSDLALDSQGGVYLTGYTYSTDFPVTPSAYQAANASSPASADAFVAHLDSSGAVLLYSTYLGGAGYESGNGIAPDSQGNILIAGVTSSANFPITSDAAALTNAGLNDAFIAKLSSDGASLRYSTYLGGPQDDGAAAIAVDGADNFYATGNSVSGVFPTTANTYQVSPAGGSEAFVAKWDVTTNRLSYCTLIGGSGDDFGRSLAIDSGGFAFITGETTSVNFPTTANAYQVSLRGFYDAFMTRLNPYGDILAYSTLIGGDLADVGFGIALDRWSNIYVTGYTRSSSFPTTAGAYQRLSAGANDAFVVKFSGDQTYQISGRIADNLGNPLGGATVYVTGSQTQTVNTDATGNYAASGLAAGGAYTITPSLTYYSFTPQAMTVSGLSSNQSADFIGTRGTFQVSGHIIDQNGAPVVSATVNLTGTQTGSTQTDSSGYYALNGLTAGGSYTLTPARAGYTFNPQSMTINALSGNSLADFAATRQYYSIAGRVTDNCGFPVAGATVSLSGGQSQAAQTDAAGNYFLSNVPGGASYAVTPSKSGYTFVPVNIQVTTLGAPQNNLNFTGKMATVTVNPVADTYVQDGTSSNMNFGVSTQLLSRLSSRSNFNDQAYLRFDLSSLCNASRVVLRLYGRLSDTRAANLPTAVYGVQSPNWPETGINWNNKPADMGTVLASAAVSGTTGQWYDFDITSYIQAELAAGRRLISLALKNQATGGLTSQPTATVFDSREAVNKPQLIVTVP
jgi:protocatechuate 3,4-dioxygenase beta subunit